MTNKLTGAMRESLRISRLNWRGLLAASALPFLGAAVITCLQVFQMRDIYVAAASASLTPTPDAEAALEAAVSGRTPMFLGYFILNGLIVAWQFTRVVQFWSNRNASVFMIRKGEWHETAAVVVYGLFVALFCFAIYVFAALVISIPLTAMPGSANEPMLAFVSLLVALVVFGLIMRFLVGFPGIAMGGTPRPMRDIWPMTRGYGFALTWRSLALIFGFGIVSVFLLLLLMVPLVAGLQSGLPESQQALPAAYSAEQLLSILMPSQVVAAALRCIFVACFSTFLMVAFARFSTVQGAAAKKEQDVPGP